MKTIEIEITKSVTKNITKKVTLSIPTYFKIDKTYYAITKPNKVIEVDPFNGCESIHTFNFPDSHFKEDAEIITESEFTEQFNKVTYIITQILQ